MIAGEPYASTGIDRTAGFVSACRAAGVDVPDRAVVHTRFDTDGGRAGMQQLLALDDPPTAIFAVNDSAAIGAMGAARDAGLRVGSDVAVVGFDDVPLAAALPIALTMIRSPMHEMGMRAVHLLMDRLAGEPVRSQRLPPQLMARASTLGT